MAALLPATGDFIAYLLRNPDRTGTAPTLEGAERAILADATQAHMNPPLPPLRPLHPDDALSRAKLDKLARLSTERLVRSLRTGQEHSLKAGRTEQFSTGIIEYLCCDRAAGMWTRYRARSCDARGSPDVWTPLYWIEGPWKGRLAIMPRPRGGDWMDGELRRWRNAGVDILESLLTPAENLSLQLEAEALEAAAAGIEFLSFPIEDRQTPTSPAEARRFVETLRAYLTDGRNVAIHCRQGIGRSGLLAAAALVGEGWTPTAAISAVSDARRAPIPETAGQRRWIEEFAAIEAARR